MRGRASLAVVTGWVVVAATLGGTSVGVTAEASSAVTPFGDAIGYGSPDPAHLGSPMAAIAGTPDNKGYWLLSAGGGVFTYGDAAFFGSAGGSGSWFPYVGLAATSDGAGYWIASIDGAVQSYGDAGAVSEYITPSAPVAGMAAAAGTPGFWLVAADGGVFSFNGASFYGSLGAKRLTSAVVGMASTPDGRGYWLVGADGGVFSFGDAGFFGSMGGRRLSQPVVGLASTPDGDGYWLVGADGGIFSFGDAVVHGSTGADAPGARTPVVGMATTKDGGGYWLATTDRPPPAPTAVPRVVAQCNEDGIDPSVRPPQIVLACGDGNAWLGRLVWSSWTGTSATGSGQYVHNTCTPDCASGTFVSSPATVRLSYPVQTSAGLEFAGLSLTYLDRSSPTGHTTYSEVAPTSRG